MDTIEKTKPFNKPVDNWTDKEVIKEKESDHVLTPEEQDAKIKADIEEAQNKFDIITDARYELVEDNFLYPFSKLEVGQGFFVPVEFNSTRDQLVSSMNKQARLYSIKNSIVELNEDGDEILENFTINARLRNSDDSFKLDGEGKPKLSVSSGLRQRLIGPRFLVRPVHTEDDLSENVKAEADGVLVIRLN